jgi:hypothetical protein
LRQFNQFHKRPSLIENAMQGPFDLSLAAMLPSQRHLAGVFTAKPQHRDTLLKRGERPWLPWDMHGIFPYRVRAARRRH